MPNSVLPINMSVMPPALSIILQGRGAAQGYNYTVGLQATADDDFTTNQKKVPGRKGLAELAVDTVDPATREISGSFRMLQVGWWVGG
jgi:hypothetical protein